LDNISINELIAEIEAKYPILAESGDIDKSSIVFTVINALRKFGVNVQNLKSEFLDIDNSRAILPQDFKSLKLAYILEPLGFTVSGDRENLTDNYVYRERIENPARWNELTNEYIKSCNTKIVTEKITIKNSHLHTHYKHRFLELEGTVEANSLAADCVNKKLRVNSPYKASISNSVLNTNFDKGKVYIQYYSLQTDENGDMVIPIFSTGAIYDYIENLIKIELSEYLINNNLNPQGIGQLYTVYKQESTGLKSLAMKESKFKGLGKNWDKKFSDNNKKHFAKYFRFPR